MPPQLISLGYTTRIRKGWYEVDRGSQEVKSGLRYDLRPINCLLLYVYSFGFLKYLLIYI